MLFFKTKLIHITNISIINITEKNCLKDLGLIIRQRNKSTLWVKKNCATFIFTVTLVNVGRFLKFFQRPNQIEMAHNKNEKFTTVP